jgi:hypothetical protein
MSNTQKTQAIGFEGYLPLNLLWQRYAEGLLKGE